jgi:hypothetical protein
MEQRAHEQSDQNELDRSDPLALDSSSVSAECAASRLCGLKMPTTQLQAAVIRVAVR